MKQYKIAASFERVLSVDADSLHDAIESARLSFLKEHGLTTRDTLAAGFTFKEYDEPTNWRQEAEENGAALADDIAKEISEAVAEWKKANADEHAEAKADGDAYDADSDAVGTIWDTLYQDEDISDRAWQYADGRFIYTYTAALIEAMQCIDELQDYASGDSGLWEGVEEYERIIQIQATDALQGATMHEAEAAIKARIAEQLNA